MRAICIVVLCRRQARRTGLPLPDFEELDVMNIVQMILDLLFGSGLGKLSGILGESETKTRSAAQAAVPALLGALSKLASTSDGAQKLISTLKQVDPEVVANPGSIFNDTTDAVTEKGGSILGSLF